MFGSILTHISKRTLHTILAVAFGLIVLFFALTRTQVGRDQLGRQLEVEFSNRFRAIALKKFVCPDVKGRKDAKNNPWKAMKLN